MAEFAAPVEGSSLEEINLAIANVEAARPARSLGCTREQGKNIVKFERLPAGQRPNRIEIVRKQDVAPAGKLRIWEAAMVISGNDVEVVAYR